MRTNKIILIGNLGSDVKTHTFSNGSETSKVSLATTEVYKNKLGEVVKNTEWHNIVFNNKLSEIARKNLKAGDKIFVLGRLKYNNWVDKNGVSRINPEIHVQEIEFLITKKQ